MRQTKKAVGGTVFLAALAALLSHVNTKATTPGTGYANFEGSQTNPIRLSSDGTRLFAVNTPNGTVTVFNVAPSGSLTLAAEIPVGIEPVSVNPQNDDVAWVVNQVSNTVSVISVAQGIVTDTINLWALSQPGTPLAEPEDIVFANNQAFISVARSNIIAVVSENVPHTLVTSIPVYGGSPRTMAVSPDGSKVYAAFAMSGNATTIIPFNFAPPQPPPTNPSLPPPPKVGLIVQASDPNWGKYIKFTMPDNDVAVIGTGATPTVSYYTGVGTINMGLGVNPTNGDLYVANMDALNLTHFETNLLGHYVNNRITHINVSSGQITPVDLNPNIDYNVQPSSASLASALAMPTSVVFDPSGSFMYVAAYGTDRVAKVDTNGNVLSFVEVSQASGSGSNVDPANKRGPRGLALNSPAQTLYSLNRISNSISLIGTASNAVTNEVFLTDPTPAPIKQGRGFLYDAKLSGSGTGSCASCHVDGDIDHLAWDLGDPAGTMGSTVQNGVTILFHPMKGAMTTQTLRGLADLSPYHWRGDKPEFQAFNGAFPALMGAPSISTADMNTYTTFANSILVLPNPYENLDRSLPATIAGGNPVKGQADFLTLTKTGAGATFLPHLQPGSGIEPAHQHQQQPAFEDPATAEHVSEAVVYPLQPDQHRRIRTGP
jgi:DNA-binding beta-propeller fold protein YncE